MSHPCHQCGAEVEQGNPFCRKCGAPQIRVSRDDEGNAVPAAGYASSSTASDSRQSAIDRPVARRQAAKAAILLALILAVALRFPPALILLPLAGMLAVQLYYRRLPEPKLSTGTGAGIGLLTGLLGFLIFALPAFPFILWQVAYHPDPALMQQLRAQAEAAARSGSNPQAQQIMDRLLTPNGLIFICVLLFVILLGLSLVLSAIGGAIGASIARRRP